ncbi:MAG TPA: DUF5985 family protein [Gemmatimonadales bacterium]|nr:DUF5985 family protein [Gemmatimonadales bacterium]
MLNAIYLLCAGTSLACAVLLLRAWGRTRLRLLLWSAACFVGLLIENLLLLVDFWVVPDVSLVVLRRLAALAGIAALLYGLIWEAQ